MREELQQQWFWDFAFEENSIDKIWFTSGWMNGLFKADLESGIAELVAEFTDEEDNDFMLFNKILNVESTLIFCPDMARKIYMFDCETSSMYGFELRHKEILHKFSAIFKYEKKVYFVPWCYKSIVELDLEDKRLSEIAIFNEENNITFYRESFLIGDNIFAFVSNQNKILKYDILNKTCKYIEMEIKDRIVYVALGNAETLLLLTERGEIYQLNCSNMRTLKIWAIDTSELLDDGALSPLMMVQDTRLYIFSQKTPRVESIDLKNKTKESYEFVEQYYCNSLWAAYRRRWGFYKKSEDGFWILNTKDNSLIKCNVCGKIIHRINIKSSKEANVNLFRYLKENKISEFGLAYPYNSVFVLFKYQNDGNEQHRNKSAGKLIWERIK